MHYILLTLLLAPFSSVRASTVTLEDAFKSALGKSEVLQQSEEAVTQSQERIAQVRGGIFPHLDLSVNYLRQPDPANATAAQFSPAEQTNATLTLRQPLFRGLREFAVLRQQQNLRDASVSARERTRMQLFAQTANAYLSVLGHEQTLENLSEQAEIYEKRINEMGGRARRGESRENDVLSAKTTEASLLAEIRMVQGQRQEARETLSYLTGIARDVKLVDPQALKHGEVLALDKYLAKLDQRPDIRTAIDQYEASEEEVASAWRAHSPTLDATGNYYLVRAGFLSDLKWDVGLTLTVPIFAGGTTQASVREAVSKRKVAELEVHRLRRFAQQEVRSLYERLTARLDHMQKLQLSVELSSKNAKLSQRDFRRGLTTNVDVQMALSEARNTRKTYDQSRFAAQLDFYDLQTAAAITPAPMKKALQ